MSARSGHDHHDADVTPEAAGLVEVAEGVWAWVQPDGTWWINNAGAVRGEGPSGPVAMVIDTCATEERTRRFLDAFGAAAGGAPVRFAANTHQHGDHTYGNCLLPDACALVGHTHMRAGLAEDTLIDGCPEGVWAPRPDWGAVTRRLPDLAMGDALTVHVGEQVVELRHPGHAAHTTGDVVAWMPGPGVLFTGDLVFSGLTPLVFMGSVPGALRSLDWLAGFGATHLVPGHGPVVDAAGIDRVLGEHARYYRFVLDLAGDGLAAGAPPLRVARGADLGEFAGWDDSERLVLNLHRAYDDLGGPPCDLFAALIDAVELNGGPLTTHVCCRPG